MLRHLLFLAALPLAGCGWQSGPTGGASGGAEASLPEARRAFQTRLTRQLRGEGAVEQPPPHLFRLVRYPSPAGELPAYVTPPPGAGGKRPAVLWLFGGFSNGIGATAWEEAPASNDQSASAFRKAGLVMMYPALRGGPGCPGVKEGFLGEVDDVLAAADYLAKLDYVDPKRIYLGGHSTGGTLALLVAASTDRFRAVFAFGPVEDVAGYGPEHLPFDASDPQERRLRAPGQWMHSVRCPTFVFEGEGGNIDSLRALERASRNPPVRCHAVPGADHFSLLAPLTRLIAAKALSDRGPTTNLSFAPQELDLFRD